MSDGARARAPAFLEQSRPRTKVLLMHLAWGLGRLAREPEQLMANREVDVDGDAAAQVAEVGAERQTGLGARDQEKLTFRQLDQARASARAPR